MSTAKPIYLSISMRLLLGVLLLLAFGLLMIGSASVAEGARDFGNKWHFVLLQLRWAGLGVISALILSRINPLLWQKLSVPILCIGLLLLTLVIIPGIGTKVLGARRWLVVAGIVLQPSELIKLVQIIYLSSWLTVRRITLTQFGFYVAVVAGLIMLQPDLGTTLVVTGIAISLYFLNGYRLTQLATLAGVGILVVVGFIVSSPYRLDRVKTFLDPTHDPLGKSYHIRQVILALGSGGVTGVGIGRSRQKYEYLPESTTDSIIAVAGEELGFIGITLVLAVYIYVIHLIFRIAAQARHSFNASLAAGVGVWISLQVVLNLAAMVALTPLTGVPLPLVSYGGSALLNIFFGIGLVLAVARAERIT